MSSLLSRKGVAQTGMVLTGPEHAGGWPGALAGKRLYYNERKGEHINLSPVSGRDAPE